MGWLESSWNVLLNLVANGLWLVSAYGFGWGSLAVKQFWQRRRRLLRLQAVAEPEELAICIRVGGGSDPEPDALNYLREHQPKVRELWLYNIEAKAAQGQLDRPETALRVVEDLVEGLHRYGKGSLKRLHFFPAGMIAYAPLLTAMIGNWGEIIVYHWPAVSGIRRCIPIRKS